MPKTGDLYTPDLLWDYLRINLEPSIMASPDGHRWASAVDALERCQAMGGEERSLRLLKVVSLIGMFRERSGLTASKELLRWALPDSTAQEIEDDLARLLEWSLVVYRKFDESYSVFDGSDFDIENAVTKALESIGDVDFGRLEAPCRASACCRQTALPRNRRVSLVRRADRVPGGG